MGVDIRVRVRGGGHVAQIYGIRYALRFVESIFCLFSNQASYQ